MASDYRSLKHRRASHLLARHIITGLCCFIALCCAMNALQTAAFFTPLPPRAVHDDSGRRRANTLHDTQPSSRRSDASQTATLLRAINNNGGDRLVNSWHGTGGLSEMMRRPTIVRRTTTSVFGTSLTDAFVADGYLDCTTLPCIPTAAGNARLFITYNGVASLTGTLPQLVG
jgi:hypothetical protein